MIYQKLTIKDYHLWIHLGVTEQERHLTQHVLLTLDIFFEETVKACENDNIQETVCYASLTQSILQQTQKKQFKTIEYLSRFIYQICKNNISQKNKTQVHIHKVSPPMPFLTGGTHFVYGDDFSNLKG